MPKRTPLYETHRRLGGRMVEFGGYELPVQYTSIQAEHAAVREAAGLFDVSHMGQIHLRGPLAVAAAEHLFSRRVADLAPGRVRYGLLCNDRGGVVDDVTCYRLGDEELMLCVNASNVESDHRWISQHCAADARFDAEIDNASDATGMLAIQGPASETILAALTDADLASMRRFRCDVIDVAGRPVRVSRTGYTGSAGFELYLAADATAAVFDALLDAGRPLGLLPAGLGARDTLRLEAALPLYGHELDATTTPFEAGLERFVDLEARAFIGSPALAELAGQTPVRRLAGFIVEGRGIARAGYPIARDGETIGAVTSGSPSPTLGMSIGLAYVPPALAQPGCRFDVLVRDRPVPARVVATPFVR